jgi:hypothetical protein
MTTFSAIGADVLVGINLPSSGNTPPHHPRVTKWPKTGLGGFILTLGVWGLVMPTASLLCLCAAQSRGLIFFPSGYLSAVPFGGRGGTS